MSSIATDCDGRRGAGAVAIDEVLWLPPGARVEADAIRPARLATMRSVYRDGGTGGVVFSVNSDRRVLSTLVVEHFRDAGWRQRPVRHLNPRTPTSFATGWSSQCACVVQLDAAGRPIPRGRYHRWRGEWESMRGDIVTYDFGGEETQIRGYASYVPAGSVGDARRRQRWTR